MGRQADIFSMLGLLIAPAMLGSGTLRKGARLSPFISFLPLFECVDSTIHSGPPYRCASAWAGADEPRISDSFDTGA